MSNNLDHFQPKVTKNVANGLNEIFDSVDYIKPIKKGTYLFSEGEITNELYVIKSGKIKVGKITDDGRELSLRMCKKGDIVGELTLYTEDIKHFLHAKVLADGEVAVIKKADLEKELLNNANLTIEFMKMMNLLIRRDQTLFRDLVLYGKKGALCSTLIRLTNSYGKKQDDGIYIDLLLTNQELANFCGTTRESVNRLLNDLRRNDIISIVKGHIIVHDLQYLRKEVKCEDCQVSLCTIH